MTERENERERKRNKNERWIEGGRERDGKKNDSHIPTGRRTSDVSDTNEYTPTSKHTYKSHIVDSPKKKCTL